MSAAVRQRGTGKTAASTGAPSDANGGVDSSRQSKSSTSSTLSKTKKKKKKKKKKQKKSNHQFDYFFFK
jgi:hypothetical protein